MFENYLEDENEYLALENYWVAVFSELLTEAKLNLEDWNCPHYNTFFSNGKKMMDGNPIFSAMSKIDGRIIRVIQDEPGGDDELRHWTDKGGKELVVACAPTEKDIEEARGVLRNWIAQPH